MSDTADTDIAKIVTIQTKGKPTSRKGILSGKFRKNIKDDIEGRRSE